MNVTTYAFALPLLALGSLCLAQDRSRNAQSPPVFNGRLYRSVAEWDTTSPFSSDDRARVPASLRSRFEAFVRCRARFRTGLPRPTSFFATAALNRQQTLERALACLFEAPGIAAAATEYTQRARILYEWEGLASSPIEEAQYAEEYIAGNPDSPFVPYLYLFVAERWRYAFEYFVQSGNKPGIAASAEKYRDFIARARGADAFVRLVADDSDGMPFLAVNVGIHARDR
jgi:hypothetical protein